MNILNKIVQYIVDPAILLIFSIGFLMFIWGLVIFIINLENSTKRQDGIRHMIYGLIGMFIMISADGIINLIIGTFGLQVPGSAINAPGGGNSNNPFPVQ